MENLRLRIGGVEQVPLSREQMRNIKGSSGVPDDAVYCYWNDIYFGCVNGSTCGFEPQVPCNTYFVFPGGTDEVWDTECGVEDDSCWGD